MKNLFAAGLIGALAFTVASAQRGGTAPPACDPDNGGLKLPAGFCALVVATDLGTARHLAVASNGDLYVSLQRGGAAVVALHDANGDGRYEVKERFGSSAGATGITLRNGYLWYATPTTIERYKMTPGQLKPSGAAEVIVTGLPMQQQHQDKTVAFDGKGSLYVNIGAPSNACQEKDRTAGSKGQDPCPLLAEHGGIWRFDENKAGQTLSQGTRFATGLRQMPALTWHDDALFIVMNNRDQLNMFPGFTPEDNAERPAEPMYKATAAGANFGWPYCFFDYGQKKLLLNPEYGGDGKTVGRCTQFEQPVASFPAHWAPVDVTFYGGTQFPAKYRNGAFIAFHGSWNRSPMPQDGYNVTFQPFANGKPSGMFEIFATGFAGTDRLMQPGNAVARADGVAEGPDGSLFIADSQKGKVWRVLYTGR